MTWREFSFGKAEAQLPLVGEGIAWGFPKMADREEDIPIWKGSPIGMTNEWLGNPFR